MDRNKSSLPTNTIFRKKVIKATVTGNENVLMKTKSMEQLQPSYCKRPNLQHPPPLVTKQSNVCSDSLTSSYTNASPSLPPLINNDCTQDYTILKPNCTGSPFTNQIQNNVPVINNETCPIKLRIAQLVRLNTSPVITCTPPNHSTDACNKLKTTPVPCLLNLGTLVRDIGNSAPTSLPQQSINLQPLCLLVKSDSGTSSPSLIPVNYSATAKQSLIDIKMPILSLDDHKSCLNGNADKSKLVEGTINKKPEYMEKKECIKLPRKKVTSVSEKRARKPRSYNKKKVPGVGTESSTAIINVCTSAVGSTGGDSNSASQTAARKNGKASLSDETSPLLVYFDLETTGLSM